LLDKDSGIGSTVSNEFEDPGGVLDPGLYLEESSSQIVDVS
jgi:hypothetical protein